MQVTAALNVDSGEATSFAGALNLVSYNTPDAKSLTNLQVSQGITQPIATSHCHKLESADCRGTPNQTEVKTGKRSEPVA
jgi:hypothetical protein